MSAVTLDTAPFAPAVKVYDTAADEPIQGADADESALIVYPAIIQIATPAGSNVLTVYQKVHADAPWTVVGSGYDSGDTNPVVTFAIPPNFAKIVRSGATEDVEAWAQRAIP